MLLFIWRNAQFCSLLRVVFLTPKLLIATHGPYADSVDQDQTAQNVQSDLGSTLSDRETFLSKR